MKTLLVLVCVLAYGVSPLRAQKAGDAGAGIVFGNPTGSTAKFWLNSSRALNISVGFNTKLALYGDYLWHSWKALPQPSKGRLPVYLGLGAKIMPSSSNEFGLRAVAGIAYWLPRDPLEIFLEAVPVLRLFHGGGAGLEASAGLRYYFKGAL
ncbi:MAG: hypothetical protein A2X34_05415 [Elusimicrobia bacterium GWC2_51_8]|nr:MAG: hypothetical protein A2X33_00815 [Elusimicrobia bacterium GWA2_51_34]OGR59179.1 MAG: hypothetical protein A2X34_05415 [Elusimicrobia bacterium GWC2_51_8]OGR84503.1 MAG: hypothetical protein A2021_03095 [Elusimicrobia bacterium GWF2_52_66]HAF94797.1 hypothetical protein [Elusimicrobiota bacterium]